MTDEARKDEVVVEQGRIRVAPGKVLLRNFTPEEKVGNVILPTAQAEHGKKLGNNLPMGVVLAVGPIIQGKEHDVDEQLVDFCKPGDIVWYDYRGCAKLLWQGQELELAPRQYIVALVEEAVEGSQVLTEAAPVQA